MRLSCCSFIIGCLLAAFHASAAEPVDFNRDIRPILNANCTVCHGGVKQAGGISFVIRAKALARGKSGEPTIVPGDPETSELIKRVTSSDPDDRMPPPDEHPEPLTAKQVTALRQWIKEGAHWGEHWAFVRPIDPQLPPVKNGAWPKQNLDRFILARLDAEGLRPSAPAAPEKWLRRVSFDLTGLPPSPSELDAFTSAFRTDPDGARAATVDRLLASPRFGERWAALWLDLARYADSMGYEKDLARVIWPYRDWLIRAFNADMPYDEFTIRQLAGDLLPNATADDYVATGFHRNSQTNTEGGTDDEEFRVAALLERVNTTFTVWQGTTIGCVQCHSHPYDPFSHEEYYKLAAFFNNTADCDLKDDYPTLKVSAEPAEGRRLLTLQKQKEQVSGQIMAPFQQLAAKTAWVPLNALHLWNDKPQVQLVRTEQKGQPILVAKGTPAMDSAYEVVGDAANRVITAIRIVSHMAPGASAAQPSPAFVVSKFELRIRRAGNHEPGKPHEDLPAPFVALDDPNGYFWTPQWGDFPNQFAERYAVLIPTAPIELGPDDRLSVVLRQNFSRDGAEPPVLRRFSLAIDDSAAWQEMLAARSHEEAMKRRADIEQSIKNAPGTLMPVLVERARFPRQTTVFNRGNWMNKGEVVKPATPEILGSQPKPARGGKADRLGMARWIVSKDNPLAARVLVNRVWAELFGIGIVETLEDFGSAGTAPSHPDLLDHLAVGFQTRHGWHLKSLLRELVLSATYAQDATTTPELLARDPRNRLLARGPRNRLPAEMVRDHALATAGLLSDKMHGPPVMPPQPDGIWNLARSREKWVEAKGEDRYRRGIYTYWRRSAPYPSFESFDMPDRKVCSARRIATNTPLQALVTLNDPVYLEASQALAKRMKAEGGSDLAGQIAWAHRAATSLPADPKDIQILTSLHADLLGQFCNEPAGCKSLADTPEDAALVIVANTILNLDSSLIR